MGGWKLGYVFGMWGVHQLGGIPEVIKELPGVEGIDVGWEGGEGLEELRMEGGGPKEGGGIRVLEANGSSPVCVLILVVEGWCDAVLEGCREVEGAVCGEGVIKLVPGVVVVWALPDYVLGCVIWVAAVWAGLAL